MKNLIGFLKNYIMMTSSTDVVSRRASSCKICLSNIQDTESNHLQKDKLTGCDNSMKDTVTDAWINNEKYQIFDYPVEHIKSVNKADLVRGHYACGCMLRSDCYFIPTICLRCGAPIVNIAKYNKYGKKERLRKFYKPPSTA